MVDELSGLAQASLCVTVRAADTPLEADGRTLGELGLGPHRRPERSGQDAWLSPPHTPAAMSNEENHRESLDQREKPVLVQCPSAPNGKLYITYVSGDVVTGYSPRSRRS